jgi:hypothetical protein
MILLSSLVSAMRVVSSISRSNAGAFFHASLLLALLLSTFELGQLLMHEEEQFSLKLASFLVLVRRSSAFRDIINVLLQSLHPIFQVVDLLLEAFVLFSLPVVVLVRLVQHRRGVLQLTADVADFCTRLFTRVTDGLAVEMSRRGLIGASRSSIVVLVRSCIF